MNKSAITKGASLSDPSGLFNASLDGNVWRAIDLHEGDEVDADALKTGKIGINPDGTIRRTLSGLHRGTAR